MVPEGRGPVFSERPLLWGEPRVQGARNRYPDNCLTFHFVCGKGDTGSEQKSTVSKLACTGDGKQNTHTKR